LRILNELVSLVITLQLFDFNFIIYLSCFKNRYYVCSSQ